MYSNFALALDGGGALGIGPARLLKEIEATTGQTIKPKYLAGTSVGGMLALLCAAGYTWTEIYKIAWEVVPLIFEKPSVLWKTDPTRPKYSSDARRAVCDKYLNIPCREAKIPFVVPAFDLKGGDPKFFDNTSDWLMSDVAMATSAAPTYFEPFKSQYIDGGTTANNPSMICWDYAVTSGVVDRDNDKLLSLATGGTFWDPPKVGPRMLAIEWLPILLKVFLSGGQARDAEAAEHQLGDRHTRIVPGDKKDYPMDDLTILTEYEALWENVAKTQMVDILKFIA